MSEDLPRYMDILERIEAYDQQRWPGLAYDLLKAAAEEIKGQRAEIERLRKARDSQYIAGLKAGYNLAGNDEVHERLNEIINKRIADRDRAKDTKP